MKHLFSLLLVLFVALAIHAQEPSGETEKHGIVLSGDAHIDVERLKDRIDLTLDVSKLNLNEVRVLRNAFAARQGYPFRDAYLRGIFMTTSWYEEAMWKHFEKLDELWESQPATNEDDNLSYRDSYYKMENQLMPLNYSKAEQAFIEKLRQREQQLLKENFTVAAGQRVNMSNVVNASQLSSFDHRLHSRLATNGFAIVPADNEQLFQIYEKNDYAAFPNFVTTDLFLQLFHLYFDCMLRDIEQHRLFTLLGDFCDEAQRQLRSASGDDRGEVAEATAYARAYFAIAHALLHGSDLVPTGTAFDEEAAEELAHARATQNHTSKFLGYTDINFGYSLFRPRGHYTKNDTLSRYFQTMMWLQTAPFGTDRPEQVKRAAMMSVTIADNPRLLTLYRQLTEPITYLMGQPDNVSFLQVADEVHRIGLPLKKLFASKKAMRQLSQRLDQIAERQTRLRPKFQNTSRNKLCLMPQRYMPDAEVLQEMVDYDSPKTLRPVPSGIDVMASLRWSAAERLLAESPAYAADRQWPALLPTLQRMQQLLDSVQWNQTVATTWIEALSTLGQTDAHAPYFMLTDEWQLKSLNAALSSWAELKHDAILYAKQPMGAECGGAGPPAPVVKGYVEPCVAFWQKADALLAATADVLRRHQLLTERVEEQTARLREEVQFLLAVSRKELSGQLLTDEEYDQLRYIGATFENLSLELLREPDQYLTGWDDVQGTDRNLALIADVYTANADNNPRKSIVYAGVGHADELYVVVEIGGYLYLMRGAVFSYRELQRPSGDQRLTDEEWQKMLEEKPRLGVPEWMAPILLPMDQVPLPNDEFFYSSGC